MSAWWLAGTLIVVFAVGFVAGQQSLARRVERETRELEEKLQRTGDRIAQIEEWV